MLYWIIPYLSKHKKKELSQLLEQNQSFRIIYKYDWTPSPRPFRQFL